MSELRLFQDTEGMVPANEVGNPVGKLIRKSGNYDLLQGTTLSKPVVGRWPKGEKVRNLLHISTDLADAPIGVLTETYQKGRARVTGSMNGITVEILGKPVINGIQCIRVRVSGTATSTTFVNVGINAGSLPPIMLDSATPITVSTYIAHESGVISSPNDLRVFANYGPLPVSGDLLSVRGIATDTLARFQYTSFMEEGKDRLFESGVMLRVGAEQTVDVTFVCGGQQMEYGSVATPYQPTDADGVPLAGYGQVRNLAMGSAVVDGTGPFWRSSPNLVTGITVQRVGSGIEGGLPYIDTRFSGTTPESTTAYVSAMFAQPVISGNAATAQGTARIVSGSYDTNTSLFRILVQRTINGVVQSSGAVSANLTQTTGDEEHLVATLNPDPTIDGVTSKAEFRVNPNTTVDVTVRIKGYQFELGTVATPIQLNYGPNDITEPGVEDVMFLYNDGNDSLNYTLPTGTYYVASVGVAGNIKYETITGGLTNFLRSERTVDVIVRSTPFTDKDKEVIEKVWSKYTL